MGTKVVGESNSVEYSTPLKIVQPLINEFGLTRDVCASALNHKLPDYWTKEDNSLANLSIFTTLIEFRYLPKLPTTASWTGFEVTKYAKSV